MPSTLRIGAPDDRFEQEADKVAEQVMRMAAPPGPADPTPNQPAAFSACAPARPSTALASILRAADARDTGPSAAPPIVHEVLRSPGQPLDLATRLFMEQRFGHEFSQVRIHTDAGAEQSARDLSAQAYTVGHDLVFGTGRYAPRTAEGRRLIAHELTHVTQQSASGQSGSPAPVVQRQPDAPADESEIGAEEEESGLQALDRDVEQSLAAARRAYYDQLGKSIGAALMFCSPERCPSMWEAIVGAVPQPQEPTESSSQPEGEVRHEGELRLIASFVPGANIVVAAEDLHKVETGPSWDTVEDVAADGLASDEDLERLAREAADMDFQKFLGVLGLGGSVAATAGAVAGLAGEVGTLPKPRLPSLPKMRVPLNPSFVLWGTLESSQPELGTALQLEARTAAQLRLGTVLARPMVATGEQLEAGLNLPEPTTVVPVKRNNLAATSPRREGSVLNWQLYDEESGAVFANVDASMTDPTNPGPPDQWLLPKNAVLPDGETRVRLRGDPSFPFTDESLKLNQSVWERYFGRPLEDYGGSLGKENLANFQYEYTQMRAQMLEENPLLGREAWGNAAIRKVPFGTGRTNIGFGELSVTMDDFADVTIAEGPKKGVVVTDVPTKVTVSAKKSGWFNTQLNQQTNDLSVTPDF